MKANSLFRSLLVITAMALATGIGAQTAWSADLHQAKAAGQIGEQSNGYLGVVGNAPPDVRALVDNINRQRRAAYQNIAQKRGTSLPAVEALAGKQAIEKTPPGQYIRTPSGQWVKK